MARSLSLIFLAGIFLIGFSGCTKEPLGPLVSDIDGNVYNTITIGDQVWMKENLRTVTYRSGNNVTYAPTTALWSNTPAAYCNIKNDDRYTIPYGKLYKFNVVPNSQICPDGWHVPTLEEWNQLIEFLGGADVAGGKLKEKGTTNWNIPNTRGTNESRFTGLPGGYRSMVTTNAGFTAFHADAYYWTSTEASNLTSAYAVSMSSTTGTIFVSTYDKRFGMSVRCIKDNPSN